MKNIFHGLGIALVTPFKQNGEIDYDALKRLIEYQIENGADFFAILATTGECPCLSTEEKNELTETIISVVDGRVPILKYCGGNNTAAVVEEIKQTNWKGIDGILSICPYYNKPSQEGLYQHFKAIAKTSPLPIVLYNVQVDEIIKNKPKHFEVISGDDALTFPMIASGAVGVISVIGNALPKEFSRMIRLEFNGEYDAARIIHHQFTELYKLLFVDGNPAGCKALLNDMGMIENVLRLPLVPTRIETKQKMNDILKKMRLS